MDANSPAPGRGTKKRAAPVVAFASPRSRSWALALPHVKAMTPANFASKGLAWSRGGDALREGAQLHLSSYRAEEGYANDGGTRCPRPGSCVDGEAKIDLALVAVDNHRQCRMAAFEEQPERAGHLGRIPIPTGARSRDGYGSTVVFAEHLQFSTVGLAQLAATRRVTVTIHVRGAWVSFKRQVGGDGREIS